MQMKRELCLNVEALEAKALLSQIGVGVRLIRPHFADVTGPVGLRARSDLSVSLSTNQASYSVGQNVLMTMTATNDSHRNVTLYVGPSLDGFSVSHNGQVIWQSNSGEEPLYLVRRILHPGQSLTLTANWTATTTGTFMVRNQMFPRGPAAEFSVTTSPTSPGAAVPVAVVASPAAPVPVGSAPVAPVKAAPVKPAGTSELAISLTTNQTTYSLGQIVQMTLTATNDTKHNVTVPVGPSVDGFSITQNGQIIWQSNSGMQPDYVRDEVLAPGQSITLSANWTATVTGTLVVQNQMAPRGPVDTINVEASA
jgi:hypothetical protein